MSALFPIMIPGGGVLPEDEAEALRTQQAYESFEDLQGISPLTLAWESTAEDAPKVKAYKSVVCAVLRFLEQDLCNFEIDENVIPDKEESSFDALALSIIELDKVNSFPNTPGTVVYLHYPYDPDDNTRASVRAAINVLDALENTDASAAVRKVADYTAVVKDFLLMVSSFLTIFGRCDPQREGMDESGFQTLLGILKDTDKSSFEPFFIRCKEYYGEDSQEYIALRELLENLKNSMQSLIEDCSKRGSDFGFNIVATPELIDTNRLI